MHEAMLYDKRQDGSVDCYLCAHHCHINDGRRGICAVRENRSGILYSQSYGRIIAQAVDPIEKKPLYHFLPGTTSYSIAAPGCNFRCQWCQNWQISQAPRTGETLEAPEVAPASIVSAAKRFGCASISYTYTEPTIFFEYAYDVARLAREQGIANVFVTNGFMTERCLDLLGERQDGAPLLAAANVDLKAWSDDFYRKHTGARLEPVLESMRVMKRLGIWVEVTTLLIPGLNDDEEQLRQLTRYIASDLGPETPWHVTRYHPDYRMTEAPTPTSTLRRARELGLEAGLKYVYEGNIAGTDGENTYCAGCGCELINRYGFRVLADRTAGGTCPDCQAPVPGVWALPGASGQEPR